jgi:hypothetical protein
MGIVILSILWTTSSVYQILILINWPGYQHTFGFQYLPASWVLIRYIGSLVQRILGLMAGLGLAGYRRWAAQTIIILSIFNIVTVFWKHPYEAFRNVSFALVPRVVTETLEQVNIPFSSFLWLVVVLVWVLNELYFGFMIYYLTRPHIKSQLK